MLITGALEVQKRKADIARERSAEDVGPEVGLGARDMLNSLKGGQRMHGQMEEENTPELAAHRESVVMEKGIFFMKGRSSDVINIRDGRAMAPNIY